MAKEALCPAALLLGSCARTTREPADRHLASVIGGNYEAVPELLPPQIVGYGMTYVAGDDELSDYRTLTHHAKRDGLH